MIRYFEIIPYLNAERISFSIVKKNLLIGGNGSGKTHILEALHIMSGGHLHYSYHNHSDFLEGEIHYEEENGVKNFHYQKLNRKELFAIQGKKSTGTSYRKELPYRSVLLSPFDMNLIYLAPSARRDFLDNILERSYVSFKSVRLQYEKTLRQRNALLKKIRDNEANISDLRSWNDIFIKNACEYYLYRIRLITFIKEHIQKELGDIAKYRINFIYDTKVNLSAQQESLSQYLSDNQERDIITGHTYIGPHLDDFSFEVEYNGKEENSAYFLSRGENKMLLLALKKIEIHFLEHTTGKPIILLFDDIFAELDEQHIELSIHKFEYYQLIFTVQKVPDFLKKYTDFACININHV